MVLQILADLLGDKETKPNKFTIAMGGLIKRAREQAGFSQAELAEHIYRRRATVSDFESGKHEPDATTLALIAAALDKPITYFYPEFIKREFKSEEFSSREQELLIQFNKIWNEKIQEVAINQVRVLAEFDPVETLMEAINFAQEQSKIRQDLIEYFNKKKKRK